MKKIVVLAALILCALTLRKSTAIDPVVIGSGPVIQTRSTLLTALNDAQLSVHGPLAADAVNAEHEFSNNFGSENTLSIWNKNTGGFSAVRFRATGSVGEEMLAVGYAQNNPPWGAYGEGSGYIEASNFRDTTKFGVLRLIQTKFASPTVASIRQEFEQGGDIVFKDQQHHAVGQSDVLRLKANGSVVLGNGALSSSATNGFLYVASTSGPPTGTPTTIGGRTPLTYDQSTNTLYAYNGGWKGVQLATIPPVEPPVDWTPEDFGTDLSIWLDPSQDVFSDAGVTACEVGQKVYRWKNQANADNYDQADEAKRPTLRQAANGERYLEFAYGCYLVCSSPSGMPTGNAARTFGIQVQRTSDSAGYGVYPFAFGSPTNDQTFALDLGGTNAVVRIVGYWNDWTTTHTRNTAWTIFDSRHDGATVSLRRNGIDEQTSARTYNTQYGTSVVGAFTTNLEGMIGNVGHYVVAGKNASDAERDALYAWLLTNEPN